MSQDPPGQHPLHDAVDDVQNSTATLQGPDVPPPPLPRIGNTEDTDFTDAQLELINRIANAVADEFHRSLGIRLTPTSDTAWLRAGDGIADKIGLQHVGWYHEEGERAHMFVRADFHPVPPDDGRDWHAVYALT